MPETRAGTARRRIAVLGALIFGTLAATAVVAIPADAHSVTFRSTVACDQNSGRYSVDYSGSTGNVPSTTTGTVSVVIMVPSTSSATVTTQPTGPGPSTFAVTQSGIDGSATSASVSLTFVWSDGYSASKTYSTGLPGTCVPTVGAVTIAPTFVDDHCAAQSPTGAQYRIPIVDGVDYFVNGTKIAPGTYPATDGATVTVTAQPRSGYSLSGDTSWSHEFPAAPTCTESVTPTVPTFTDDTCVDHAATGARYTIPATTGVDYYVDGIKTTAGTYQATDGTSMVISATAQPGYVIAGGTSISHSFTWTPTCTESVTPSAPAFTDAGCGQYDPVHPTYTIPAGTGLDWFVDGVPSAPGTYRAASGSTMTVIATPEPGYVIDGDATWTHTFPVAPACTTPATAAAPTFGAADCVDGVMYPATVTVPTADGVDYALNGAPVTAGIYPVPAGDASSVTATPQPGRTLTGDDTWAWTAPEAADQMACLPPAVVTPPVADPPATGTTPVADPPVAPVLPVSPVRTPPVVAIPAGLHARQLSTQPATELAYTGTALPLTDTALVGGLVILLGGTLCLVATRRRAD